MKKFIVSLFSNHFGIVLVALNVCYFASIGFRPFIPSGQYLLYLNSPSGILTTLSVLIIRIFSPGLSFSVEMNIGNTLFVIFMIFQWLFIAWIAKTIARKFRPAEF